jgi:FMN phosphatase YigB (HAD superfamily)
MTASRPALPATGRPLGPGTPRAVTFDVWHTLVYLTPEEEERYFVRQLDLGTEALTESRGGGTDRGNARRAFERAFREACAASSAGRSVPPAAQLRSAARRLGCRPDVDRYLARLDEMVARQPFKAVDGARGAIDELRGEGFRVALLGNTVGERGSALRGILRDRGFDLPWDAVVFSDEEAVAKPAPEIFALALRRLGGEAAETVHVGDGWTDVEGARRAGLRGSVLFRGHAEYGAQYVQLNGLEDAASLRGDRETRSFAEVPRLVRELFRSPAGGRP